MLALSTTWRSPRLAAVALQQVRMCSRRDADADVSVSDRTFPRDAWTNVTPHILRHVGSNLHARRGHPLGLVTRRIVDFVHQRYRNARGNAIFSVHDTVSPVVSMEQNFDSLLVPKDHPSRSKSDSYYLNKDWMLRAHTTAHQAELVKMGLDSFLVVGDVYRRDEIDSSHYPVFHQMDGVHLLHERQLVATPTDTPSAPLRLFEDGVRTPEKQERHTLEATKIIEKDLKECLLGVARELFGSGIEYRWVDCTFPFTHPSWELEILYQDKWLEVLGCGVMEQAIVDKAGADHKAGWAFGLGLERLAMKMYGIPDIRLFWSTDSGFLSQFAADDHKANVVFKAVSKYPQCSYDISFFLPKSDDCGSPNDFYDLVRDVGGDLVEQVTLVDDFTHPKTGKKSQTFRIVYRSMERTLTKEEATSVHQNIESRAKDSLGVTIR